MSVLFRFSSSCFIALLIMSSFSCKKQESEDFIAEKTKSYTGSHGWKCASGTDCQDVFELELKKGAKVDFKIGSVSDGSVAQIALYAPNTALGTTNLFTLSLNELRCNTGTDCGDYTEGEAVNAFIAPQDGRYLLAITREWGTSCGGEGTYELSLKADQQFSLVKQTIEDSPSKAKGYECKK